MVYLSFKQYFTILAILMRVMMVRSFLSGPIRSNRMSPYQIGQSAKTLHSISNEVKQFSFGIIADIQYADSDDSYNFQGTKVRRYRQSLEIFREAVKYWSKNESKIENVIVLGDMIDARAASEKNSDVCVSRLKQICDESNIKRFHFTIGNHCHYNFKRNEIFHHFIGYDKSVVDNRVRLSSLDSDDREQSSNQDIIDNVYSLHYDWSPYPGWRFLFLDSYDVSLIGHSTVENKELAESLLKQHNPNDLSVSGTWFRNLPFEKLRWVPYNGMISQEQLEWLKETLAETVRDSEKVIIFCHQPVYSPKKPNSLIWNAEEVLKTLHSSGNVCMWIAGHDHDGNYCCDDHGIHHLIPPVSVRTISIIFLLRSM